MRILDLTAHSIEEADMLRLFTDMGHDMFSPGAYVDPSHPLDDMREPMPDAPHHPDLKAIIDALPATKERPDRLWNAKDDLPQELIDWCDVIICHHVEWRWLWPQWRRIRHKRVIWRTVGQSTHPNEWQAQPYTTDGLEIVRYSPRERNIPNFAGEDALIRFWKDPDVWTGWTGEQRHVLFLCQNPMTRGDHGSWINFEWALEAMKGLPVRFVGPGTEDLPSGIGKVSPERLKEEIRAARCALYTGTQPASYTLALIEMMMTGTPVVSISPEWMTLFPYSDKLYEGHMIAPLFASEPAEARQMLRELLNDDAYAQVASAVSRKRALLLFGKDKIMRDWAGWLDEHRKPGSEPDLPDVATWGEDA